ncbi:hypothetical protein HYT01_02875 [Candidatus Giovannonibacteria bacterium]|nr:hypothetical protein [Candidatus Giovannonibacteria bacterium]
MIAPYTLALHGVMAGLCLGSLIYLFYKKKDSNSKIYKNYFNWFLLFFLYNAALITPLLVFKEVFAASAYFYLLALLFLGIACWNAFKVGVSLLLHDKRLEKFWSGAYIIGIIGSVFLQFLFFEIPLIAPGGKWIFWYSNNIAYFYIFFMFVAGWTFAAAFIVGFKNLGSLQLKIKALALFGAGAVLPFAAFYYFRAVRIEHVYLAFFFSILGLVFFLAGNLVGLFKRRVVSELTIKS